VLGLPLGATHMLGRACMLNWIGAMPDRDAVLADAAGHWHDYGKQPRSGRKVGHATWRSDSARSLAKSLRRIGHALDRESQVSPCVDRLDAELRD
jgi:5-(carboxyamino)imidazole ribonucleotide synthase